MSQRDTADADLPLPLATRHDAAVQGHWLLARLGKRRLPEGVEVGGSGRARAVADELVLRQVEKWHGGTGIREWRER